jgi:hypothetical protein
MHYRIGTNDYVMSVLSGQRELLFIEYTNKEHYCILEQPRRKPGINPGDSGYIFVYRSSKPVLSKTLFEQSLNAFKSKFKFEFFECNGRVITRIQFGPQQSIKWAAYKVEGVVCFAPYKVDKCSVSDIYIRDAYRAHERHVTFESVDDAISALGQTAEKSEVINKPAKPAKRQERKAKEQVAK